MFPISPDLKFRVGLMTERKSEVNFEFKYAKHELITSFDSLINTPLLASEKI